MEVSSNVNRAKSKASIHFGSVFQGAGTDDEDCEDCLNAQPPPRMSRYDPSSISKLLEEDPTEEDHFTGLVDTAKRNKREYLIPKDKAAWLNWMVSVARSHVKIRYLTDKELKKVIIRARPNLDPYKKSPGSGTIDDPDLPGCFHWNETQVGEWIASVGWPQLKEMFITNMITGRRLVLVDCAELNEMGMRDFKSMQEVAGKIRELLGILPPNTMRPIMRFSPYENFLRRKVYSGRSYDQLTFQKFCEIEGFNYELVSKNRNMAIPCTTEVTIVTRDHPVAREDDLVGDSDEDNSLRNAPTVEFLARNALVRNRIVDQIMGDIMECVFLPTTERKYGKDLWGSLKRSIGEGYGDLHLYYPKQKLQFASGVAHALIDELAKTANVLNDIKQLEIFIGENVTKDDMHLFRSCAQTLMEEAMPIVGLHALGELDLENIFKQEPEYRKFVGKIAKEAERKTNELVPDAKVLVEDVITEALSHLSSMEQRGKSKSKQSADTKMHHITTRTASEVRTEGSHSSRHSILSGPAKSVGTHGHEDRKHHPQHQQHGAHPGGKAHHPSQQHGGSKPR